MRPSRRMSSRSRASASMAAISSPRLGRTSGSEGIIWEDMSLLQKLPGSPLSRNFFAAAQDKDRGDLTFVVPAKREGSVVPAKAGTHSHRPVVLRKVAANVPKREYTAYGFLLSPERQAKSSALRAPN